MSVEYVELISGIVGYIVLMPALAVVLTLLAVHTYMDWQYYVAWRRRMANPASTAPTTSSTPS